MSNIFTQVKNARVPSNTFDLSHDRKMSFDMGWLIPSLVIDTIPGDKFSIQASQLIRMAPMVAPIMHKVDVYQHFFFVPYRILWPNWEKFISGGEDGMDTTVHPFVTMNTSVGQNAALGSLLDYLGLPLITAGTLDINPLALSAYQKIYEDYYRDQNMIQETWQPLVDGDNSATFADLRPLRFRAWEHDYFTSALPWTQKGVEATIPLGEYAPIEFWTNNEGNTNFGPSYWRDTINGSTIPGSAPNVAVRPEIASADRGRLSVSNGTTIETPVGAIDNANMLRVDLSQATSASINELRVALRLQEWLEKNARGGSRYIETILNHFGVQSSDGRLQRPEYMGGGKSPISFSEVLQTAPDDSSGTKLGSMAGHGINVGSTALVNYRCEDFGYIIGILSVMPKTAYQQGVPRHFRRADKFDYPWPSFAHLGEQEILLSELWNDMTDKDEKFGYIPRYSEMKYIPSTVHGDFKDSLDTWHMGRIFSSKPQLNSNFTNANPTSRIFAVDTGEHHLYGHIYNQVKANRKLPVFGTPML